MADRPSDDTKQEALLKSLLETTNDVVWAASADGSEYLFLNEAVERVYGRPVSEFLENPNIWLEVVHPDDRERVYQDSQDLLEQGASEIEYRIVWPNGGVRWLNDRKYVDYDDESRPTRIGGIATDITERIRADGVIRIQRDLGLALGAASGIEEGLRLCFEAALNVSGMDCGGIYTVDETSGALDLLYHQGLSEEFVRSASRYETDSDSARLVSAGKPVYTEHLALSVHLDEAERREHLRAIAIVPVKHEDRVIGSLNVASHSLDEVPVFARDALEAIAASIGSAISRLRTEEALHHSLAEVAHSQRSLLALSQAAQAVQRARTPEEVYRTVGDEVVNLGYHTVIFRLTADRAHLTIPHLTFEPKILRLAEKMAGVSATDYRIPVEPGGTYDEVLRADQTIYLEQVLTPLTESLPEMTRPLAGQILNLLGLEQAVYAPLKIGSETQGLLLVMGTGLSKADMPAVTAFANQTAIALENARLYEAAREREEHFRSLIENATDVIAVLDGDGTLLYGSPSIERALGFKPAELIDTNALACIHPEDASKAAAGLARIMERPGDALSIEFRIRHKDGSWRVLDGMGRAVRDKDGALSVVLNCRDITEKKEMQAELLRREKLATIGQLAAGIGHDLRNPLGAIKNAAYYLNMVLTEIDPDVKETLEILDAEVAASERIIGNLLDFARAKPPIRQDTDVNGLLQETMSRIAVPENVEVAQHLDEPLPTIGADPDQLARVFDNLVLNAIQAMADGGRLVVRTGRVGSEWVSVSVSDTGAGIPEEDKRMLFEPLFTTKAKGIGLGLALVRSLVEGHGGTVEVESAVGEGSTFTVRLPVKAAKVIGQGTR